ncbi:MAG TPA: hypothetical protein VI112_04220 [Bacteroidia bacterium]|jgi:hypothetical protein
MKQITSLFLSLTILLIVSCDSSHRNAEQTPGNEHHDGSEYKTEKKTMEKNREDSAAHRQP